MQRIKYLFTPPVAAPVTSDNLPAGCDLDSVDVSLDGHRFKRLAARNAVAVGVEGDSLILVDLGGLVNAGIKGTQRQGLCSLVIPLELLPPQLGDLIIKDTKPGGRLRWVRITYRFLFSGGSLLLADYQIGVFSWKRHFTLDTKNQMTYLNTCRSESGHRWTFANIEKYQLTYC